MAKTKKPPSKGTWLRKLGFDQSRYDGSSGHWKVACSQCEALVIQGVPCHEMGCPNRPERDDE